MYKPSGAGLTLHPDIAKSFCAYYSERYSDRK